MSAKEGNEENFLQLIEIVTSKHLIFKLCKKFEYFYPSNDFVHQIYFIFNLISSLTLLSVLLQSGITSSIRHHHPNYPIIGINTFEGECKCRCSRPFFSVLDSPASVANVSGCLYPCHSPEQSLKDQRFLTAWITTWYK